MPGILNSYWGGSPTPPGGDATWNPADKTAGFTLSGGDLTASDGGSSSYENVRATEGKSSGKYYWEITVTSASVGNDMVVGLRNDAENISDNWSIADDFGLRSNGSTTVGGSSATVAITPGISFDALNAVIMQAVDFDAGKYWQGRDGVWAGTPEGDPAAGTDPTITNIPAGTWKPWVGTDNSGNTVSFTANFGATAYAHTAPAGFGNF